MLNFVNSIPENVGWVMVGFLLAMCVVMVAKMVGEGIRYFKECRAEDAEVE